MTQTIALYPGSFDPVTLGHLDVVGRARLIFDRLVVAVLENPQKRTLFSVDERVALLRDSIPPDPGVEVATFAGLTVDHARAVGATAVVRGLRAVSDFESELQMALMNRRLAPSVDTVFLMTSAAHLFVSSSIIREVCRLGGPVDDLVPPASARALQERLAREGAR